MTKTESGEYFCEITQKWKVSSITKTIKKKMMQQKKEPKKVQGDVNYDIKVMKQEIKTVSILYPKNVQKAVVWK